MQFHNMKIRILREIERSCLGILTAIGASYAPDMRYTLLPYTSDMPAPCISQMSSPHAAHMSPFFDPQMPEPSSSYMPQMTVPDPSWHHDTSSEWSDLFVTGSSLDLYEEVEGVTQLVDVPAVPVIPDIHVQETSTVIEEGPLQVTQEQERLLKTFVRMSKQPQAS
uniref:Uncharacterized protein LOC105053211 isoform X2 n=1 Tax=Elaeis guineensis var. tenera TaxID=51953 RepID=A0A6I9S388_ELAGV|nr:uncharacterized protein LOC105053211 isoform X2 [Elaeis guineensis]